MVINGAIRQIIKRAIDEDVGKFDITTSYLIKPNTKVKAKIIAKEPLMVCGLGICRQVFKQVDKTIKFKSLKKDGNCVKKFTVLCVIEGKAGSILKAERVALNFLMHLSGVASDVHKFVKIATPYKVKILDTRKTLPGLRVLQKYAVKTAGGLNHRKGLWDEVMIKENHLFSSRIKTKKSLSEKSLSLIIKKIKKAHKKVEVEVENLKEFKIACSCMPDIILLDNFSPASVARAVNFRNTWFSKIKLEASGGIDIKNVKKFARTKIDYISIGALTHSPQARDFSLKIS